MFKELVPLLKSTTLNLALSLDGDDHIKVIVQPKPSREGENPALSTPLSLEATPDELDEKFGEIITGYTATRTSLADALAASQTVMEAAKKTTVEETAKKASERVKSIPADPAPLSDQKTSEEAPAKAANSDIELF